MAKEQVHQLVRLWEIAYKTTLDYKDQFYTRIMNGDVVQHAKKVLDKKELEAIKKLEERERSLRRAWEQALL